MRLFSSTREATMTLRSWTVSTLRLFATRLLLMGGIPIVIVSIYLMYRVSDDYRTLWFLSLFFLSITPILYVLGRPYGKRFSRAGVKKIHLFLRAFRGTWIVSLILSVSISLQVTLLDESTARTMLKVIVLSVAVSLFVKLAASISMASFFRESFYPVEAVMRNNTTVRTPPVYVMKMWFVSTPKNPGSAIRWLDETLMYRSRLGGDQLNLGELPGSMVGKLWLRPFFFGCRVRCISPVPGNPRYARLAAVIGLANYLGTGTVATVGSIDGVGVRILNDHTLSNSLGKDDPLSGLRDVFSVRGVPPLWNETMRLAIEIEGSAKSAERMFRRFGSMLTVSESEGAYKSGPLVSEQVDILERVILEQSSISGLEIGRLIQTKHDQNQ